MLSDFIVSTQKLDKPVNTITSTNRMSPKDEKAFTLLEILIAMFIFAIILSTLYTAYTGTFRNMDETESHSDIYQMARIALERMVEDLESAYISPWPTNPESEEKTPQPTAFVGETDEINDRSTDSLRFLSRAHLTFDEVGEGVTVARIAYDVRQNEEEEESFVLYRSDTPGFEEGPEKGAGGLILCDGLHGVDFTYYDEEGRTHDRWDSTTEEFKGKLPVMVSIMLEFVNKTNPEAPLKFMTGVVLPMAEEAYEKAL